MLQDDDQQSEQNQAHSEQAGDQIDDGDDQPRDAVLADEALPKDSNSIAIPLCSKVNGVRAYDKELCCYFCQRMFKHKIKRHLVSVHKNEPEVVSILSKSKSDQKLLFSSLVHRGNFNHNVQVLELGTGLLIVGRRPKTPAKVDDYLPCIYCLAFYLGKDLHAHTSVCQHNSDVGDKSKNENKNILGKARMLLAGALHQDFATMSDVFRREVFDTMRIDEVSRYVRTDDLIIKYGATLHRRHGKNRCHDISQKMRHLARLVLAVKQSSHPEFPTLDTLISGAGFDCVLETTGNLCQLEDNELGRPLFKNPSLGLKLGHILVKCAEIKRGIGIRNSIKSMIKDADAFINLHGADWTDCVSSTSHATFKHRKYNNPDILPMTADLLKLKKYQEAKLSTLTVALTETPTYAIWRELLEVVYTRVVIFNKRRCGETTILLLSSFEKRPTWQESANDEIVGTLKPLEQQLLKR